MSLKKKIRRFAKQMKIEIANNKHKTGSIENWIGIESKVADLEYHKAKMMIAMRTGNKAALKEYIADCANILFAIGNELGLYNEPSINDGMGAELLPDVIKRITVDEQTQKRACTFVSTKLREENQSLYACLMLTT
jgi:hypothetical protein